MVSFASSVDRRLPSQAAEMGVSGLMSLFQAKRRRNNRGWVKRGLRGPLVVDANQFCHQTAKRKCSRSTYAQYYHYVTEIVQSMKRHGIEPYFIFDGVDKQEKLTSEVRRDKTASKPTISTLAYTVFHNALRDMEVEVYVADGEGDAACVEVANFLNNCPILSCDSDFFLFNIPGGFINLFNFLEEFERGRPMTEMDMFLRDEFVRCHFPNNHDYIIFLFPAILGNGIQPATGHLLGSRSGNAKDVDNYIFTQRPTISCLPEGVKKNFEEVKKYYNNSTQLDPRNLLALPIPNCPRPVPEWFRMSYRQRIVPIMIFDALVNGTQHHSSTVMTLKIRQCCYALLGINEVKEYHCTAPGQAREEIVCRVNIPGDLAIHAIESGSDDDSKRNVFYFALGCERSAAELNDLSEEERLFVCSLIFWRSAARPRLYVVKALLACFVKFSSIESRGEIVRFCRAYNRCRISNGFSDLLVEWQCVFRDALTLYLLLRYPPQRALCPSRVLDENVVFSLARNEDYVDDAIKDFISDDRLLEKYRKMSRILVI